MGSTVTLGLARLELDWGKNESFVNHSALFLPTDKSPAPYYYADDVVEEKEAYVRPLRSVTKRLEMLGYSLAECERRYAEEVAEYPDYYDPPSLTFADFARILKAVHVRSVGLVEDGDYDLGEYVSQGIMRDPQFIAVEPRLKDMNRDEGTFFENLDPYITLRLLAENPENLDLPVVWRIADIVEGGYVRGEIYEGVPREDVCLLVTEGSTDTNILQAALPLAAPDVCDFFDFVDMSEHYPFTGTGNLFRFAQGLARIGIQNRILIVTDNDTAGREAFGRISKLDLPHRMRVVTLPDLGEARSFPTLGPSGRAIEDVNGRALAIELFLDLKAAGVDDIAVRWTAYNDQLDQYQGHLVNKDEHTRCFLEAVKRGQPYDFTKLTILWEHLITACSGTASRTRER